MANGPTENVAACENFIGNRPNVVAVLQPCRLEGAHVVNGDLSRGVGCQARFRCLEAMALDFFVLTAG